MTIPLLLEAVFSQPVRVRSKVLSLFPVFIRGAIPKSATTFGAESALNPASARGHYPLRSRAAPHRKRRSRETLTKPFFIESITSGRPRHSGIK